MCGIAGILKFDPSAHVNEDNLLEMRDTLRHRGPDGAGMMAAGRIGLAHRRLAIIDLEGGHQPMCSSRSDSWLTYNGELYNYKELRCKLQELGESFATDSDTEVLLRCYEVFGKECINMFDGMFAFAIWDSKRQCLFMGRDRLGIKPLYYTVSGSELRFASEIKALLVAPVQSHSLNKEVLADFLANRYVAGSETFFTGIHKLLPAHTLTWTPQNGISIKRYWQPPVTKNDPDVTTNDYVNQIRTTLTDSVRRHLVSDVPVGLFLSGGLDSTILSSIMAPMVDEPIKTFSVGFSESAANELDYARMAADAIESDHHELKVTAEQFFAALPHLIWHEDEPLAFSSSVPLHLLSKVASEHVKVVLTGEGADELFIGYDYRYRVTAFNQHWGRRFNKLSSPQTRERIADLIPRLPRRLRRYAERSFLSLGTEPRNLFCENFSVFRAEHRAKVLNGSFADQGDPYRHILDFFYAAGDDIIQCMSHADLQTYLVELLMKQDQMSMSASLESRVPFLDNHLVELVTAIPAHIKQQGWKTKTLLRQAVTDLVPAEIMNRKKMGFPVPVGAWLRGAFWPLLEDLILSERARERNLLDADVVYAMAHEHRQGKADHGERLWLLLNLEIWQRIFVDGEHPSEVYSNTRSVHNMIHKAPGSIAAFAG